MLNNEEKKELRQLADSVSLRQDFRKISKSHHNPFVVNGRMNIDNFLVFLTQFNQFINHKMRPFHKVIDRDMRL